MQLFLEVLNDVLEFREIFRGRLDQSLVSFQHRLRREEEKKLAGAVVSIESIHRGLVRSEDKRKVQAAKSGGDTENDDGEESAEVQLSAALVEDLPRSEPLPCEQCSRLALTSRSWLRPTPSLCKYAMKSRTTTKRAAPCR
jgi:hypothetical protein